MFPEMAQTYEEGAKDREQPFRNRPDGGTGLRQGKLNMKEAVKQRRERTDECKPLARLQAGKGHWQVSQRRHTRAHTCMHAHACTHTQSWPICNVSAQSFKRKIPSHTANQNC